MMVKKFVCLCFLSVLFLASCTFNSIRNVSPDSLICEGDDCPSKINGSAVFSDGNEVVDYTEVAADYKSYGERTPVDRRVARSGLASNVSSSIPPVLEDEVVEYEESVGDEETTSYSDESSTQELASDEVSLEDPVEDWLAEEGVTLKELLSQWSDKSGWRLIWKTNRNYTLTAGAMFRARFADAASALVRAFARARPAPVATFYKGNRVLVIETMEDENAYE
ncbi:MAG: toxin co-regulated pilus biosynthesis Q family protein [Alphaproteobacteria bacterium]